MSDIKLGELVTEEVERDAIHIALVPVRATETLRPGQHIGLQPGSELFVGKGFKPHIGIVDPFLKKSVKKDDIWLGVAPPSIICYITSAISSSSRSICSITLLIASFIIIKEPLSPLPLLSYQVCR